MNILLTSAGRRLYLVEYFKAALGSDGKVMAADVDPNAPALQAADVAIQVPPFTDPDYFDHLYEICLEKGIRLMLSLNDLELPLLAREAHRFRQAGVEVLVSSADTVERCLDKWQTYEMLIAGGIDTPRTYRTLDEALCALSEKELAFPVVVKPRWGTGSIGIEIAYSKDELCLAYSLVRHRLERTILASISRRDIDRAVLIQEMVNGTEYGLDIVNDLSGEYVTTFVKQKMGMRSGETDKAITVSHPELTRIGERISRLLKHVAIMDCDVMVDGSGRIAVLELNPRFGGGYPFSHVAGANIPAAILAWLRGAKPNANWLRIQTGICAAKYDRIVITGSLQSV